MEGGFLTPRKSNAASLAVVIALHGAAIAAMALSKRDMPIKKMIPRLTVENIPIEPDPEPIPEPKPANRPATAPSEFKAEQPIVKIPSPSQIQGKVDPPPVPNLGDLPGPKVVIPDSGPVVVDPPRTPVRVAAQIDPRFADALQPPYPPSEQRMGNEGSVTIRVTIGTDGRVKAVSKISAASDAFYRATERQARTRWRFKPATADGKPVESEKTMTVHFRIES